MAIITNFSRVTDNSAEPPITVISNTVRTIVNDSTPRPCPVIFCNCCCPCCCCCCNRARTTSPCNCPECCREKLIRFNNRDNFSLPYARCQSCARAQFNNRDYGDFVSRKRCRCCSRQSHGFNYDFENFERDKNRFFNSYGREFWNNDF